MNMWLWQNCLTLLAIALAAPLLATPLGAQTAPDEEAAVEAIRRVASNVQRNRDGTVRLVRFSRPEATDDHLPHLQAFKRLDYLAVVTPTVTDKGLASIRGLANLDSLFLSNSGLTDAGTEALVGLERLERLYLDNTRLTDRGLANIVTLKTLSTLSLGNTDITDAGVAQLGGLENLEVLFLCDTEITDAAVKHLGGLQKLRGLYLDRTRLTGAGLQHLSSLQELETLSLSGTKVASSDLAQLAGLERLQDLLLYDTAVRDDSLAEPENALSATRIHLSPLPGDERNALGRFLAGETLRGPPLPSPNAPAGDIDEALPAARLVGAEEVPDFQRHVIPLLGRLGCNGRTCHGSFQGQAGFRLSMFGYDFAADLDALRDRIDIDSPDDSLILLKPTLQEDHGGGLRFEQGGWESQLLRRWIESGAKGISEGPRQLVRLSVNPAEIVFGAPDEEVPLQVVAVWSDGTREDVTKVTRFQTNDETVAEVSAEGVVRSQAPGDTYVVSFYDSGVASTQVLLPVSDRTGERFPQVPTPTIIDELVLAKLSKLGIVPAPLCTDDEFLRRVGLDLVGTLPTPAEVQAFLADESPDKRARKADELLQRPAYAAWWTVLLSDLTGSNAQYLGTTDMNQPAAGQWNSWIRRRLRDNVGWDRIAAGIILAESRRPGQTYERYALEQSSYLRREEPEDFAAPGNPMHYYWFRSNNQEPADRALSFGYVFLGVRLQCAQCHKHPFDQWSQQDFDKFTQFFTRIKTGVAPDGRASQVELKTRLGVPDKLNTAALRRQMYMRVAAEGLPIPWNEVWVEPPGEQPQSAKLLGGAELDLRDYDEPREPLMAWLLSADNPYFARAFVNRVWAHYFGVGIVDPADDFNLANPPSNKPLLDWLTSRFVEQGYDIQWLHRTIINSRTYQLSWRPNQTNRGDERNFSRARIRRLPAEVTIDAILQATADEKHMTALATTADDRKIAQHPRSIQTRGIDYSLLVFGKPLRTTNCDCERQMQPTLLQSLYVRNDHELLGWLERSDGWLAEVAGQLGQHLAPEVTASTGEQQPAQHFEPPDASQIDDLVAAAYLRTLSRPPNKDETERARNHLATAENTVEGLRDLLWALLNTQEFLTNH